MLEETLTRTADAPGLTFMGRFTVESVGSERRTEARVKERAHNWTKYREATDV